MSQQDSEPVSQQAGIQEQEATKPENPPNPSTTDFSCKCLIKFHLVEGREHVNCLTVPLGQLAVVRENMLKALENPAEKALISMEGSQKSAVDFCAIPVKNIIYFEVEVLEITKTEK